MKPRRGVLIITPHGDGEAGGMWGSDLSPNTTTCAAHAAQVVSEYKIIN
ncbi:MAG: hypothetical protein K2M93_09280 [Muribaculaceae bacterium]|nr:hypothetical protein [Muribaculaceae bacterium]